MSLNFCIVLNMVVKWLSKLLWLYFIFITYISCIVIEVHIQFSLCIYDYFMLLLDWPLTFVTKIIFIEELFLLWLWLFFSKLSWGYWLLNINHSKVILILYSLESQGTALNLGDVNSYYDTGISTNRIYLFYFFKMHKYLKNFKYKNIKRLSDWWIFVS